MKRYKVWVQLSAEYDDIEAENEEEAFIIASDCAIEGGDWERYIEEIDEESEEEVK